MLPSDKQLLDECDEFCRLEVIKELVEIKGADVNTRDERTGKTPLMLASTSSENIEEVKYLIEKGAEVNAKDNKGLMALDYAYFSGKNKEELVDYLKSVGAKSKDGYEIVDGMIVTKKSLKELFEMALLS